MSCVVTPAEAQCQTGIFRPNDILARGAESSLLLISLASSNGYNATALVSQI